MSTHFTTRLNAVVEYGFWGFGLAASLAPRFQDLYPNIERLSIVTDILTEVECFFRQLWVDTNSLANTS